MPVHDPATSDEPGARGRSPRFVRRFVATESAGGIVLVVAAVTGLVWANSPWRDGYDGLWSTELTVGLGRWAIREDLRHWVNDGLMALFFFVVGLEIKREVVVGDLRDPRAAAVPVIAALGGMAVPALLYGAVTFGGAGSEGWGIPMATDIAFALGVVALLGPRVPPTLKLFLLTLAIVDDIGAIAVIAVFYAADVDPSALLVAGVLLVAVVALRAADVTWVPLHLVLAVAVWASVHASGVHATVAGVALGLLVPVRPRTPAAGAPASPAERLEQRLHPWTSFVVVPLFALANTAVELTTSSLERAGAGSVALGVALGLVVGKVLGITGATWVAVRSGVGRLPDGVTWGAVVGVGAVAGIGFTVSLFVAELAFGDDGALRDAAKLGVLTASVVAATAGSVVLRAVTRRVKP